EAGGEGVRLQQPQAEAVDRRDPGAVELAGEIGPTALVQRRADAGAKLGRGLARVRDDEQRVDVEPVLADRADEPLNQDGRLAVTRQRLAVSRAQKSPGLPLPGERPVDAAERLDPDEIA